MKAEELAFVNQQLAGMLRNSIPLESALGQLCASMRRGMLREELERLHADLASGVPFEQAVAARKLPAFYGQMLRVGAKSGDLPGMLTLVADYYQRASLLTMRLKGLMVYPAIVLVASLMLSTWLTFLMNQLMHSIGTDVFGIQRLPPVVTVMIWVPPVILGVATLALAVAIANPAIRRWMRWWLPASRDASLAGIAAAVATMLRGGCSFDESLELLCQLESNGPAGRELTVWRERLSQGETSFARLAAGGRVFPPLFVAMVTTPHDNLVQGFAQASAIFEARAAHHSQLLLEAALPVAILGLGALIAPQLWAAGMLLINTFQCL